MDLAVTTNIIARDSWLGIQCLPILNVSPVYLMFTPIYSISPHIYSMRVTH